MGVADGQTQVIDHRLHFDVRDLADPGDLDGPIANRADLLQAGSQVSGGLAELADGIELSGNDWMRHTEPPEIG